MGSENETTLPFIDLSGAISTTGVPLELQVRKALEDYGCFVAFYDKVSSEIQKAMFGGLEGLFDRPLENKLLNVSSKPYGGYYGQSPRLPLYETLGIEDPFRSDMVEHFVNALWPERNPSFSESVKVFSRHMLKLDNKIRRMILESLGLEKYLDEHMSSTYYLLRFMKYQVPKSTETNVGLKDHTDNNLITILHQNQVEGLEVQTKDGEWISVKPSANSFLVMGGETLYAWSNGRLHFPHHRVIMKGNEPRYSVGFFSCFQPGYIVKAPEELVDGEHPLLFRPFDYIKFVEFHKTEKQKGGDCSLKAYCGV